MPKLAGIVKVKINGAQERALPGVTVEMGGANRTTVTGSGRVLGTTEETTPGAIEWTAAHAADTDLRSLIDTEDATVLAEVDDGTVYLLANASFVGDPATLTAPDGYTARFEGDPIEKL